jgi:hypothetical protein
VGDLDLDQVGRVQHGTCEEVGGTLIGRRERVNKNGRVRDDFTLWMHTVSTVER